jgi:hypothetical protein
MRRWLPLALLIVVAGIAPVVLLWKSKRRESVIAESRPTPAAARVLEIRKQPGGTARTKQVELKPGETREIVITDED